MSLLPPRVSRRRPVRRSPAIEAMEARNMVSDAFLSLLHGLSGATIAVGSRDDAEAEAIVTRRKQRGRLEAVATPPLSLALREPVGSRGDVGFMAVSFVDVPISRSSEPDAAGSADWLTLTGERLESESSPLASPLLYGPSVQARAGGGDAGTAQDIGPPGPSTPRPTDYGSITPFRVPQAATGAMLSTPGAGTDSSSSAQVSSDSSAGAGATPLSGYSGDSGGSGGTSIVWIDNDNGSGVGDGGAVEAGPYAGYFTDNDPVVDGPDPAYFTIYRTETSGSLTVEFDVNYDGYGGSATPGLDFSSSPSFSAPSGSVTIPGGSDRITITINPIDDDEYEGCESISLQLRDASGSGSYYYIDAYRSIAGVTIAEGDITPAEYEKLVQKRYGGQLNVNVVYDDEGHTQEVDVSTPEYLIQAKKLTERSFQNWPADRLPGDTKAQLERYKKAADRHGKEVIFVTPVAVPEPWKSIMEKDMGIKTAVVEIPAC